MGGSCLGHSGGLSSTGVWGPIDHFFPNKSNDNKHGKGHLFPKDAKEALKLDTMDVGRFFFENGIHFNVVASLSFASICRHWKVATTYECFVEGKETDLWNTFGHETPEWKKFEVKVLSLTCAVSGCERNRSTCNQVHTKRRNRLATIKLHKLVYVMYNKRLMDRHLKKQKPKENEDLLVLDHVTSDDEWIVDKEDDLRNDGDDYLDFPGMLLVKMWIMGHHQQKIKDHPTKDKGKGLALIDDDDDEWMDGEEDIGVGVQYINDSSLDHSSDEYDVK
ncbi:hypothetical protein Dsin_000505 [Dipteronia sinensis]|uniref:Uncharacterized protein n=1 Tax=Dipteronia sinensis TaxID=43782 RepID=A0AAE0EHU7_9ROSI|nr:hypothetical protein Dsin_000505 [Dipteronia sinensis]